MDERAESAKRARFVTNAATNLAYFVFSSGLMIWYVPYLIHHLGPAAYGLLPLTSSLVVQAVMLSEGLNASSYRYLAVDMGRGDAEAAQRTFNSAAALTMIVCAVLCVIAAFCTWLLPKVFYLAVPELEAQFLFISMFITVIASIVSGLFGAPTQILHRFDLRNLARSATLVARMGVVVLCFSIWPASLWHVGGGLLLSAAVGLGCEMLICRRLVPHLAFRPFQAGRDRIGDLMGLTKWSTVNMVGLILLTQFELVLVNLMFGAEMTGHYGSILLLPVLVSAIAEVIVPVLSPEIMARYAAHDRQGIERLARSAIRLLSVGIALPAGLLCGFGHPLLSLWLGSAFAELDLVLTLVCGHLAVTLATRPLSFVLMAYGAVRLQAVVTVATGVAFIGVALGLARWSGLGVVGIAAATALIWIIKNALFMPAYSAHVLGASMMAFIRPLGAGLIGFAAVALAGRLLTQLSGLTTWLSLGAAAALVTLAYAAMAYAVLLTDCDRRMLREAAGWRSRRARGAGPEAALVHRES